MATKKISELDELENLNDNDTIPVVDVENEITKKITVSNLAQQISNRKAFAFDLNIFTASAITNNTTSYQRFGNVLNITTTGKPLAVFFAVTGYISGGNMNFRVYIDNNLSNSIATTSSITREQIIGFYIFDNIPAGEHTIQLAFACDQSNRTATIERFVSNPLIVFEI